MSIMEVINNINDEEYLTLRRTARQALAYFGIASNPGFTDHNIVSSLRQSRGLSRIEPWDEWGNNAQVILRNEPAEIAGVEPPLTIDAITSGLAAMSR